MGGVKADDVLVAVDGTPLDSPRDLQRVVSSTPVGKRVRVVLLREGRGRMPAVGKTWSDAQLKAILDYLTKRFSSGGGSGG